MANQISKGFRRLRRYFKGKTVIVPDGDRKVKLRTVDPALTAIDTLHNPNKLNLFSNYYNHNTTAENRMYLFYEYNLMERDPIISRALDILAEETCLPNEYNEIVKVQSDDNSIQTSLEYLFHEVLNVEHTLSTWVRQMLKYGDSFIYLNIKDKLGIVDAIPLNTIDVEREEDDHTVEFKVAGVFREALGEEQMLHFRYGKDIEFFPYGRSILEPVRRHWKQMTLLEDFMMVYYLLRSVNQRVYRVDVGNLEPSAVPTFVEKIRQMFKKKPLVNDQTGEYDLRYDPMTMIDDVILPVREGYENTTFDEIPASTETDVVKGIDYFRQKIMAGLGIPNFLLNYEETINSKSTASAEDIRFAKSILSIQKIVKSELEKIAVIHLILQGFTKEDLYNFDIELTAPSDLKEMEELDKFDKRIEVAGRALDSGLYSRDWIYENILQHGTDEISDIKKQILSDRLSEKMDEEIIANTELPESGVEEASQDLSLPDEGEGSQGGQPEPSSSPDETQQTAPSGRVEDMLDSRTTNDEPNRKTRDRDED